METLVKQAGYSKYHFSRKFKEEMGAPVTFYIKCARVERAKFLLAATVYPVAKIAMDLQFIFIRR